MRPPRDDLADRAFELRAVVETGTEHDLRVVIGAGRLEIVELLRNLRRAGVAQHLRAQFRIHALHRDEERRQVELLDAPEVVRPHVRHRDEVAVEEGQAVVVVLDGEALAHVRRNHVDEAEVAVIRTVADAVEDGRLKLDAEFLVDLLLERDHLLLAVGVLDEHVDLLVGHGKAQVDDVAESLPVDLKDLVARHELQFFCQAARIDAQDDTWIVFAHILTLLYYKQRSDA